MHVAIVLCGTRAVRSISGYVMRTKLVGLLLSGAFAAANGPALGHHSFAPIVKQLARRGENFAGRTNVDVLLLVKAEVFPTEGPILAV
jgi:hypothetical protein